jgi:hypothetical protein
MVLLAAVVGYPDLGPALFPALYHQAEQKPDQPWTDWIDGLRPRRPDPDTTEQWTRPLDGRITPARTHRWKTWSLPCSTSTARRPQQGRLSPTGWSIGSPGSSQSADSPSPPGPTVTRLIPDARPLASDN